MKVLRYGTSFYRAPRGVGHTRWPFHDFFALPKGEMIFEAGGEVFQMHAGDAVLVPPEVPFHSPRTIQSSWVMVLHFEASRCGEREIDELLARKEPTYFVGVLDHPQVGRVAQRITELHKPDRRVEDEFLITHLMWTFLAELVHLQRGHGLPHPHGDLIRRACLWAEKNVREARTVGTLAERAEMSESHFRAVFRRVYGMTAGSWLTHVRIAEARRLLSSTNTPIKEIALLLGYAEVEVFHRAFLRLESQTPGQYRKQNPPLV